MPQKKKFFDRVWDSLPDADDVFAYDTVKSVRVLDRRLGLVFYTVFSMILFYVVIFVFMIERKYQELEKSMGWVLPRLITYPSTHSIPFDLFDLAHNPTEIGAVFVPTRLVLTKGQENRNTGGDDDYCESPLHPCKSPVDCEIENPILQKADQCDGMCMRRQWCPAEGSEDASVEILLDPSDYEIQFATSVHFHKFVVDVSSAHEQKPIRYPNPKSNTYKVSDLLRMANLKTTDIQQNGAMLLVNHIFKCELDDDHCKSSLESANVDSKFGYNYAKSFPYTVEEDGKTKKKRDLWRLFGVRVAVFTTGIGAKSSFSQIVLQVSSAIALLAVAQTAADFFLEYMVPERKHYMEQKIVQT